MSIRGGCPAADPPNRSQQRVVAVGEDPADVRRDEPAVHEPRERDRVADLVADLGAPAALLELVAVHPQPVRPALLHVHEVVRRLPLRDLGEPSDAARRAASAGTGCSAPARISIGCGVRIRKSSHDGVSACRFPASAWNANTSDCGRGTQVEARQPVDAHVRQPRTATTSQYVAAAMAAAPGMVSTQAHTI